MNEWICPSGVTRSSWILLLSVRYKGNKERGKQANGLASHQDFYSITSITLKRPMWWNSVLVRVFFPISCKMWTDLNKQEGSFCDLETGKSKECRWLSWVQNLLQVLVREIMTLASVFLSLYPSALLSFSGFPSVVVMKAETAPGVILRVVIPGAWEHIFLSGSSEDSGLIWNGWT